MSNTPDTPFAELLHAVQSNATHITWQKSSPISDRERGDAVGVAACCLCLQGVKGGEGLRGGVVGDAPHSVSYPNIKPNEADVENQRNGEK